MVFSSTVFLFVFLPVTLLLYYLSQNRYRNILLLAASLLFYAYGEPKLISVMIASIISNYFFALAVGTCRRKSLILALSIIFNLTLLYVFKYLGFSIKVFNLLFHKNLQVLEIALPIGISFFTFQAMSYVIDVYTGKAKVQRNILDLGLYISLFPQLIAGPIVRYSTVAGQIKSRLVNPGLFGAGSKRFMCGFCKKILLSNNLAMVTQFYFGQPANQISVAGAWLGSVCYTLQIYYDFSGYSDMAIGLGKMFGFEFEENFNYPYISKSITDFWRRWHISLGRWFRDYVYIPLGGSRVSVPRHIINMGIVWLLTGIWHGANYSFIAWGAMYFAALVLEKYVVKPDKRSGITRALYRILTLFYINFGWVIFNSNGLKNGIRYCLSMIGVHYNNVLYDTHFLSLLREYGGFLLAGIIFAAPAAPYLSKRLQTGRLHSLSRYIVPLLYTAGFFWSVSYLILGAHNPFIYFNF